MRIEERVRRLLANHPESWDHLVCQTSRADARSARFDIHIDDGPYHFAVRIHASNTVVKTGIIWGIRLRRAIRRAAESKASKKIDDALLDHKYCPSCGRKLEEK